MRLLFELFIVLSKKCRFSCIAKTIFLFSIQTFSACGGDGSEKGSSSNSDGSSSSFNADDSIAPQNYQLRLSSTLIDAENQHALSAQLSNLQVGDTFQLSWKDSNKNKGSRSGNISGKTLNINNIDLSNFSEGNITFSLIVSDTNGNVGNAVSAIAMKQTQANANGTVAISGTITFDLVPHNPFTSGLDYHSTYAAPARGVLVEALNSENEVLVQTSTDYNGAYRVNVQPSADIRIRAYAQLNNMKPFWDISVIDNTNDNALYAIQGSIASSTANNSVRNLHAGSGWDGVSYTESRSAAAFAILDTVIHSLDKILLADPGLKLPALQIKWSPNNRASRGNKNDGDIGNSHYSSYENTIYLLGSENNDADEYDRHVIAHEFGHFLEFTTFRSDSIGGSHSLNENLDMRVAFGEGFSNAFSAISLEDPKFRDSFGSSQHFGFHFNIDRSNASTAGWFNESSIHEFIYNFYDDNFSNFIRIIEVLKSDAYTSSDALTSVHLFGSLLKSNNPLLQNTIDDLAREGNFALSDIWGSSEYNDGELPDSLPIYKTLRLNSSATRVCSNNLFGEYNKHGNAAFAKVDLPRSGSYTITAERISGRASSDPDFWVLQKGLLYAIAEKNTLNRELLTQKFNSGMTIIALWDAANKDKNSGGGEACFDLHIRN